MGREEAERLLDREGVAGIDKAAGQRVSNSVDFTLRQKEANDVARRDGC